MLLRFPRLFSLHNANFTDHFLMELHSAPTPPRAWGIGRPKKACGQCKMQKVRCSGDRPICKRCSKVGHKCMYEVYQAPRTSKRIPGERLPSRSSSVQQRPDSSSHTSRNSHEANLHGRTSTPLLKSPSVVCSLGIPPALVSDLIDVYFANAYNATLLLHKSAFLQAVVSGTARPHVILSVCALAANFYRDGHRRATLRDQGYMMEWADRAGKLVFSEIEEPHEDNIVTLMNLALLFYALGVWRRGHLHKGNAVLLAQALGLGFDRPGREDLWDSEVRRRRFWACYLMAAHSSEPTTNIAEPSEATMKLTLPWNEEEFERRSSSQPRICLVTGESNGSLFGELIRIMTIWSAVNSVLQAPEKAISSRVNVVNEMHQRVSVWLEKLPATLGLTPANVPGVPLAVLPKLLLIHMVYHQSLMALHASIVPVFSWSPGDTTWLHARQISAQVAYEHACAVSDLFRSVLNHFPLLSALPSFVAYAAYCSSAIQIPFMWSTEASVREKTRDNVRVNVRIITILSQYWKLTALFEIYVRYLYRVHAESPTLLENEPKSIDPTKLTGESFRSPDASVTILGFNRILWAKTGAYAATGEEPTELDSSKQSEARDDHQPLSDRFVPTKDHVEIFPSQVEAQYQPPLSFSDRIGTVANSPATAATQDDQTEQFPASEYNLNLDSFFPFDTDMAGLNLDFFDHVQPGMSLGSMEMFAGWNGPEGNEFRHTWF